jgi:hypothetical protein
MVLRGADIVSAIIVLSLSLYFLFTSFYSIWITVILLISATGCVILWEAAEFITLCARGGRVGIHPGAHVGLHLVLWIYLALGLGSFATFAVVRQRGVLYSLIQLCQELLLLPYPRGMTPAGSRSS